MRPHTNGTTPNKKGGRGRGNKAYKGGVKSTLVKAKVSAVKSGRRLKNGGGKKDEIEDLLERTNTSIANNDNLEESYVQPKKSGVAKKIQNIVGRSNRHTRMSATKSPGASSPRSRRFTPKVENAEEATETATSSSASANGHGGLLRKTMSKIWRLPDAVVNGLPYSSMGGNEGKKEPASVDTVNTKMENSGEGGKCIIS